MQNTPYNNNQGYYQNGYNQPPYMPPRPPKAPGDALAMASMVIGIVSGALLIFTCFTCFFISLPGSIVGLILGIVSYKKRPSNPGLAGLITNIVTLIISFIVTILIIIALIYEFGYYL